jgi:hypothetical protein
VAARVRRDPDRAKSVQLNIDDDTIRRFRIRTGKFPVSFSDANGSALRSEVSKSAYYLLIAGAVARLPNNARAARLALYDRAEIALTAELLDLGISDEQVAVERLAFERAIRKIENDASSEEKPEAGIEKHPRHLPRILSFFSFLSDPIWRHGWAGRPQHVNTTPR